MPRWNSLRNFETSTRRENILDAHRIAIHGGVVLRRNLHGRDQVLCQKSPIGIDGFHPFSLSER